MKIQARGFKLGWGSTNLGPKHLENQHSVNKAIKQTWLRLRGCSCWDPFRNDNRKRRRTSLKTPELTENEKHEVHQRDREQEQWRLWSRHRLLLNFESGLSGFVFESKQANPDSNLKHVGNFQFFLGTFTTWFSVTKRNHFGYSHYSVVGKNNSSRYRWLNLNKLVDISLN